MKPKQAAAHSRFPAARFAHQPERFAGKYIERNAVDRSDDVIAVLNGKVLYKITHPHELLPFCLWLC
jgi:hypothetical protein